MVTNPPSLPVLAWFLNMLRGIRYGLLVWDIYPDHLVAAGIVGPKNPIARLWKRLSGLALRRASLIVTIGDSMARVLLSQSDDHSDRVRVHVIPNWADINEIRPIPKDKNAWATDSGQRNKITVLYSGNIGASHGLERLVDAAKKLETLTDIHLLIVGDGLGLGSVLDRLESLGCKNVTVMEYQAWGRVPEVLATGEVSVVSQERGSEHLSMPSKTYSTLAAGSAVLALTSEESDLADLVRRYEVGAICDSDDPDEIAGAIERLVSDPDELSRMRTRARDAAEKLFSEDVIFEKWIDVLEPLISQR